MLERLRRLLPPPAPVQGWGTVRLMAAARALGTRSKERFAEAMAELRLGAKLDQQTGEVGPDAPGASGFWLDDWGKVLGTPRMAGEADSFYAPRIITEVTTPGTTNQGLAKIIDLAAGTSGTRVVEAYNFFEVHRLNDGHRLNSGVRLMGMGAGGTDSLWNCFLVLLATSNYDRDRVVDACNRRRAAGTRLLDIVSNGRLPAIDVPSYAQAGIPFPATISNPESGATYEWAISDGAIVTGQGTISASIVANTAGTATLTATQHGGANDGKTGYATVHVIAAISSAITMDAAEAPAGEAGHIASVPIQPGSTFAWTITGGVITAGQGTRSITFSTGEADSTNGAQCVLTCTVKSAIGVQSVGVASVNILPYPYTYTHQTAPLAPGATENFDLDLGKRWHIKAISTSAPARVRVYSSASARTADAGRVIQPEPQGVDGLLAEAVTTTDALDISFREWAWGMTPGNAAYVSVVNTGASPAAITTTISTQKDEA